MAGGEKRLEATAPAGARDGDTEQMLPEREVQFAPTIHHAHRRPLGVGPAPLMVALAAGGLVLAIVSFGLGSWIAGIVLLALSTACGGLFIVAIRREPGSGSARLAKRSADRASALLRLIRVTTRSSLRTGVELVRAWHRRERLRFRLKRRLTPLGEAVYRDDLARAAQLKAQAIQLDHALRDADRRRSQAVAALREQLERERANTQRTETLPVVERTSSSDSNFRR